MSDEAAAVERPTQRVDRWLWNARFFKTRTLAATAVAGGKVQVNGDRVKPARRIGPGDRLDIRKEPQEFVVLVLDVADRRLPAREAAALYVETAASAEARALEAERRQTEAAARPRGLGRPTKRDRRVAERLKGKGE